MTDEQYALVTRNNTFTVDIGVERIIHGNCKSRLTSTDLNVEDFLFENYDFDYEFNTRSRILASGVYALYLLKCNESGSKPKTRNAFYKDVNNIAGLHTAVAGHNRLWIYGISNITF